MNHRDRMREIADEFRRRGRPVAIGGPFASMAPEQLRAHADVLFLGEAERTWPQFLSDLRDGAWQSEYREVGTVDMATSPMPAFELAPREAYLVGVLQASRGCPFSCDFCDVIIYLGRKQRHKPPERIVRELDRLYELGYHEVFVADDNFTASRKRAHAIATAIAAWNETKPSKVTWLTQLSIDVARDSELLELCFRAGLRQAFVGVETPNKDALREVGKRQNLKRDLVTDLQTFFRQGIAVQAGMIVGFDADTLEVFRHQYEFLQAAGVPTITLNLLNAPYGTPLYARMEREGRLITPGKQQFRDFHTAIEPKNMSVDQLAHGARWLLNKLYAPDAFLERLRTFAALLPDVPRGASAGLDEAEAKRGLALWHGIMRAHRRLGPEHHKVALRAMQLFRRKDKALLPTILLQYKHVVSTLMRRGAWDPGLSRLDEPDFAQAS